MKQSNAHARARLYLRGALILLTVSSLQFGLYGTSAAETPSPTATETVTVEPTVTGTPEPTKTPRPTSTPTATPTPPPAQDLAVSFFNNFCNAGQPLLATVFNTSATPLENQTLRLTLSDEKGVLEEHDHQVSIPAYGTMNLPLFNPASPPWMKVEMRLVTGPADPNPANDSASCGVAAVATETPAEPTQTQEMAGAANFVPGSSSRSAPPPASGIGGNAVWRQPEPTPTALSPQPTVVAPLTAPSSAQPIANGPQPSLTPIGDAGGGLAPQTRAAFPSRTLLMTGVVLLAAGTSWAFYYLTRPPKNA
jgi:hypothetical protein